MNFLVTEGYAKAAEKFKMESGTKRILRSKNDHVMFYTNVYVIGYVVLTFVYPYMSIAEIDLASIEDRMAVNKAVQSGNVEDAIEMVNDLNPEVCLLIIMYIWLE